MSYSVFILAINIYCWLESAQTGALGKGGGAPPRKNHFHKSLKDSYVVVFPNDFFKAKEF